MDKQNLSQNSVIGVVLYADIYADDSEEIIKEISASRLLYEYEAENDGYIIIELSMVAGDLEEIGSIYDLYTPIPTRVSIVYPSDQDKKFAERVFKQAELKFKSASVNLVEYYDHINNGGNILF